MGRIRYDTVTDAQKEWVEILGLSQEEHTQKKKAYSLVGLFGFLNLLNNIVGPTIFMCSSQCFSFSALNCKTDVAKNVCIIASYVKNACENDMNLIPNSRNYKSTYLDGPKASLRPVHFIFIFFKNKLLKKAQSFQTNMS